MNKILISILVICGIVGCKLPEQPELTPLESAFISKLEEKCKCKVIREVNPHATLDSKDYEEGWYLIKFSNLPCGVLNNRDSLKQAALVYSRLLHNKILIGFGYKYDEVVIVYGCSTGENSNKSINFKFRKGELEDGIR